VSDQPAPDDDKLALHPSPHFADWLATQHCSLALTTYQAGRLFLLGPRPGGRLALVRRRFRRCMGLWSDGQTLWLTAKFQVWRFENVLAAGAEHDGHDRLFVPRVGYTTGAVNAHDIVADGDGRPVFVNTRYSCLATVSEQHSFVPLWKPPWVGRLAPQDRCHLNGLALRDGRPRYVTAAARTDTPEGWRAHRHDGGVVVDAAGEVVASGLSMPHSPRWHGGRLWLLEAGTGYLGHLDGGRFERVTFCPGFLRGLAFHGDFAVAGVSACRQGRTFEGLAFAEELQARGEEARCAVLVIDLRTGALAHWLRLEGPVRELYDVVVLPGVRRPGALGLESDQVRRVFSVDRWRRL
jgi:uncharacterized protein (TIGR03032 family)